MFKAEVLKSLIEKTGMPSTTVAKTIGISYYTFRTYIEGTATPSLENLIKIADYFAVPLDMFTGRCDERNVNYILTNYSKYFMQLRTDAYEKYLAGRNDDTKAKARYWMIEGVEAPWPYNLYDVIYGKHIDFIITDDMLKGLDYILDKSLTKQCKVTVLLYYQDGLTLDKIGKKFGVQRERVRQILAKAIRIMRHPSNAKVIFNGYTTMEDFNNKLAEVNEKITHYENLMKQSIMRESLEMSEDSAYEIAKDCRDISDLKLTVRAYNCLYRADIKSINKLLNMLSEDPECIIRVRNLGSKSYLEILDALDTYFGTNLYTQKYAGYAEGTK